MTTPLSHRDVEQALREVYGSTVAGISTNSPFVSGTWSILQPWQEMVYTTRRDPKLRGARYYVPFLDGQPYT